ncbi:hypothetical protein SLS62_007355 [Diatrype stigma]|uniref:Gamma-glutamylcyclotransferase AIG2-like domain-containing protein n=1 Tax=Diatrype stigma TaxID=117547 RepID=A0AAN9UQX4_9PEZI
MPAPGNPLTRDSDVADNGKHAEADAIDSIVLKKEKVHPLPCNPSSYPAGSEGARKADAINIAVLRLRGYRTDATGAALYELANKVEDNELYEKADEAAAAADDDSDVADEAAATTSKAFSAAINAGLRIAAGVITDAEGGNTEAAAKSSIATDSDSDNDSDIDRNHNLVFEKPLYFFFYGSLQDTSQLRSVCDLESTPLLRRAFIRSWRVMMWGPFPALVPGAPDDVVHGMVWRCDTGRHVMSLCEYESRNYRLEYCDIHLRNWAARWAAAKKRAEKEEKEKKEKKKEKEKQEREWEAEEKHEKKADGVIGAIGGSTRTEELKAEAKADAETSTHDLEMFYTGWPRVEKRRQPSEPQQSGYTGPNFDIGPIRSRSSSETSKLRFDVKPTHACSVQEPKQEKDEATNNALSGPGGAGRGSETEKSEADFEIIRNGRVFVHAGAPELLKEGSFDLETWRDLRHIF